MANVVPPLPTFSPDLQTDHVAGKLVIAIFKIGMSDPAADLIHTGAYDADGGAILKKSSITINSGEFFELNDPAELLRLLEMGAVRYPTASELAVREREAR